MRKEIEKIVKDKIRHTPIAGDWDGTRAIFMNETVMNNLADKICSLIVERYKKLSMLPPDKIYFELENRIKEIKGE